MPVLRQMLSVRMAYGWTHFVGETRPCSRESSNLRDPFAVVLLHVLAIRQRATASARDRCHALTARGHTHYNTKFS